MTTGAKIVSGTVTVLKRTAWALTASLFMICVLFLQPLAWLLSLLLVILTLASCVSSLSVWAPIGCFAALLGLHLFILFFPIGELERRLGLAEQAGPSEADTCPAPRAQRLPLRLRSRARSVRSLRSHRPVRQVWPTRRQ